MAMSATTQREHVKVSIILFIIQLQAMLDIRVRFGDEMDIKFNAKKSCLFKVGRNCKDFVNNLLLGDDVIDWSSNLKYLGVQFQSATYLKVGVSPCVRKFYAKLMLYTITQSMSQ